MTSFAPPKNIAPEEFFGEAKLVSTTDTYIHGFTDLKFLCITRLELLSVERNKYLTNLVFSVRTVSYESYGSLRFMARALRAWAINRRRKK